jgi:hypothetical protein
MIHHLILEMNPDFQPGFIKLLSTNRWILFIKKEIKFAQLTSIFKNDEGEAIYLSIESYPQKDIEDKERKQILDWAVGKQ